MMQDKILEAFWSVVLEGHWGDIASVIGLFVAIIGFLWTIIKLSSSNRKFNQAIQVVSSVDTLASLAAVKILFKESVTAWEKAEWERLMSHCSEIRRLLIDISSDRTIQNDSVIAKMRSVQTKTKNCHAVLQIFSHNQGSKKPSGYKNMGELLNYSAGRSADN